MTGVTRPPKKTALDHGRRTTIDFESETVCRILDAAESIFAENCYAGTRMDEIAAVAGVNKATIYYHIGGKEKLYDVVLTRHFTHFANRLERELADCADPVEGLRGVVRIHAEEFIRNNNAPRTIAHELAGGSRRITPELVAAYARIHGVTARFVAEGMASGRLRPVNPAVLQVVLAGSLLVNTINAPFRSQLAATLDPGQPPMPTLPDMAAFLEDVVIAALTTMP
ncbi:TetR/AcrR family transcriptional regulator [Solidesulfovibrio sp.]